MCYYQKYLWMKIFLHNFSVLPICFPASTQLSLPSTQESRSPKNNNVNPPLEEKILTTSILVPSHVCCLIFRVLLETNTAASYLG